MRRLVLTIGSTVLVLGSSLIAEGQDKAISQQAPLNGPNQAPTQAPPLSTSKQAPMQAPLQAPSKQPAIQAPMQKPMQAPTQAPGKLSYSADTMPNGPEYSGFTAGRRGRFNRR
jgi:hypothetical protein